MKSKDLRIYERTRKSIEYFWEDIKRDDSKMMSSLPISDEITGNDYSDEFKNLYEIKKSSFVLMLYNIIEATVTKLIQEIVEEIIKYTAKTEYKNIDEKVRKLWISLLIQRFGGYEPQTKVKEIDSLFTSFGEPEKKGQLFKDYGDTGRIIDVLGASGNLDFRKIRRIFESFGISVQPQEEESEENLSPKFSELKDIKELRNKLAHGGCSFLEGFADKGINNLKKYMDETFECLETLVRETEKFCEKLRMSPEKGRVLN